MVIANFIVINKVDNAQGSSSNFLVIHRGISAHYSMRHQRRSIQILSKVNATFKTLSSAVVFNAKDTEDFKQKLEVD